jgi:hypothetical protein
VKWSLECKDQCGRSRCGMGTFRRSIEAASRSAVSEEGHQNTNPTSILLPSMRTRTDSLVSVSALDMRGMSETSHSQQSSSSPSQSSSQGDIYIHTPTPIMCDRQRSTVIRKRCSIHRRPRPPSKREAKNVQGVIERKMGGRHAMQVGGGWYKTFAIKNTEAHKTTNATHAQSPLTWAPTHRAQSRNRGL